MFYVIKSNKSKEKVDSNCLQNICIHLKNTKGLYGKGVSSLYLWTSRHISIQTGLFRSADKAVMHVVI